MVFYRHAEEAPPSRKRAHSGPQGGNDPKKPCTEEQVAISALETKVDGITAGLTTLATEQARQGQEQKAQGEQLSRIVELLSTIAAPK